MQKQKPTIIRGVAIVAGSTVWTTPNVEQAAARWFAKGERPEPHAVTVTATNGESFAIVGKYDGRWLYLTGPEGYCVTEAEATDACAALLPAVVKTLTGRYQETHDKIDSLRKTLAVEGTVVAMLADSLTRLNRLTEWPA